MEEMLVVTFGVNWRFDSFLEFSIHGVAVYGDYGEILPKCVFCLLQVKCTLSSMSLWWTFFFEPMVIWGPLTDMDNLPPFFWASGSQDTRHYARPEGCNKEDENAAIRIHQVDGDGNGWEQDGDLYIYI